MLNELVTLKRGLDQAKVSYSGRHPSIKSLGRVPAWSIRLTATGTIQEVVHLDGATVGRLWTLRDGQQNGFPFSRLPALLASEGVEAIEAELPDWKSLSIAERLDRLDALAQGGRLSPKLVTTWPGKSLLESNAKRWQGLRLGEGTAALVALFDRFALAARDPAAAMKKLVEEILDAARVSGSADIVDAAYAAFVAGSNVYYDVPRRDFGHSVGEAGVMEAVSRALSSPVEGGGGSGLCVLSGETTSILSGNFPQPNLPLLGQSYIFSRNRDIPAAARYGRSAADSMPIGAALASDLAGALVALTAADRRAKTWQIIPGEKPKQNDLLIAYVRGEPDIPVVAVLAAGRESGSGEPMNAVEISPAKETVGETSKFEEVTTAAGFEKAASIVIEMLEGNRSRSVEETPVDLMIFRQVDPANRKVVHRRSFSVAELKSSVDLWREAGRNLPDHLRIRVKGKKRDRLSLGPRVIAPVDFTDITRMGFIRGGRGKVQMAGLPAGEAVALMLERSPLEAQRTLTLLLSRGGPLLAGTTHERTRTGTELKEFDAWAALRIAAGLGILLHIIGRRKETYMHGLGFKLGQLLNAMDVVHRGYCIDVRGGQISPTLIGNSFFNFAQSDPLRALSALGRRWAPYERWANLPSGTIKKVQEARQKPKGDRNENDWMLLKARAHGRRISPIAHQIFAEIAGAHPDPDDRYRAELFLGYVAGLEPGKKGDDNHEPADIGEDEGEEK